jgi:hypothetical protein
MKLDKLDQLKQVREENQLQIVSQEKRLTIHGLVKKDYSTKKKPSFDTLLKKIKRFVVAGFLSVTAITAITLLFLQVTSIPTLLRFKPTTVFENTKESIKSFYLSKWVKPTDPFDFFTDCVNKKGVINSLDSKTYCTINNQVYFKTIELPKVVSNEAEKEQLQLLNHQLYLTPSREPEFTKFTVGKDLSDKAIWGNTVYTANLNQKSNAISYLWVTNTTFVGDNQEQKNSIILLNNILTTDTNYTKEAQSAYIVDPKQLDLTEILINPSLELSTVSLTPNPLASHTKVVLISKKEFATDSQLTVKVFLKIRENIVVFEETLSSSYSKFFREEYLVPCLTQSTEQTTQAECYNKALLKDEDFIKIVAEITAGLTSGFSL